jgi:hypothetical protein
LRTARCHEALIKLVYEDRLVGHISRDATAIDAREKPVKIAAGEASITTPPAKRKRGRPRKGEVVEKKEPRRLERQADMSLAAMLADLPTHCAVGTKRNAKGHTTSWIGYKLRAETGRQAWAATGHRGSGDYFRHLIFSEKIMLHQ